MHKLEETAGPGRARRPLRRLGGEADGGFPTDRSGGQPNDTGPVYPMPHCRTGADSSLHASHCDGPGRDPQSRLSV